MILRTNVANWWGPLDRATMAPVRAIVASGSLSLLVCGCVSTSPNELHCARLEGDATCRTRHDGKMDYCGGACVDSPNNDGCVKEPPECAFPCGGYPDPNACSDGGTATTGDPTVGEATIGATTSVATECEGTQDCTDPNRPICVEQTCVACDQAATPDDACAERDAELPVCGPAGACVQCTVEAEGACGTSTPVCDPATNTCAKCTTHEQCGPESACAFTNGTCIRDCVTHVDGDGGQAHTTIDGALDATTGSCVIIVHALDGANSYDSVQIPAARQIALFGADDGPLPRIRGEGISSVRVAGAAFLRGLEIRGNPGYPGVYAFGGKVYIERSRIVLNAASAVNVDFGGAAVISNSMLGGNVDDVPAVDLGEITSVDIVYSTLIGGDGSATALKCDVGDDVRVRNSILVNDGAMNPLDCAGATITYSALETLPAGEGNVGVGAYDALWFTSVANGDFHLTTAGIMKFGTVAVWRDGDPTIDFDLEPRVGQDGLREAPGADLPTP